MADAAPLEVEVRGLAKRYGAVEALRGVSFGVRRGEIVGYLGPNGAGKTTTINILCGLVDRDGGEARVAGRDVARDPVGVKQRVGVVPEESNLYPELSCRRNLDYLGELYGLARPARRERATALLDAFGLAEKADQPFRTLSRGMKRRLTVAAALVHQPAILFLDEPTAGLDVPSARALRALIQDVNRQGTTLLLTTHNLAEAEQLCRRIVILVAGCVVTEGTAQAIQERVAQARVLAVAFSGEVDAQALRRGCPAVRSATRAEGRWRLEVADAHQAVAELLAFAEGHDGRIVSMNTDAGSFEDAFVRLLEDGAGGGGS